MNITKANDVVQNEGIAACLFAESKTGKTTEVGYLPGKILLITIEGGITVLQDTPAYLEKRLDVVSIDEDLSNLSDTLEDIMKLTQKDYNFIVLDSITDLQEQMILLSAKVQAKWSPTLQDYGKINNKLYDIARTFQQRAKKGVNSLILAKEQLIPVNYRGQQVDRMYPDIRKNIANSFCGLFDVIGRMVISEKEETLGERFILLDKSALVMAGDRIWKRKYCKSRGEFLNPTIIKEEKDGI